MMLHTRYQGSRPSGLDKKIFRVFPIKAYVKHLTLGRAIFDPRGHNLNKLRRSLLGDVTYQISRFYA